MQLEVVICGILCAENYENRLKLLQAIEKRLHFLLQHVVFVFNNIVSLNIKPRTSMSTNWGKYAV